MSFGLSNSGISVCHLIEMCLGDQEFVTLLFYLDNICIFAANVNEMLGHMEIVFQRLKDFNLKIKPKKCHIFQYSIVFLRYVLSAEGICDNPEKVQNWPIPSSLKELHSFLGLASYYRQFIPNFTVITKCLHEVQLILKKTGKPRQMQPKIVNYNGQMNTRRCLIF